MTCVIIGCHGQDGRLLSEQLQAEGKKVIGIGRNTLDILNRTEVDTFLKQINPAELYYLAAFHHSAEDHIHLNPPDLFDASFKIHLHGWVNFLEGVRQYAQQCHLLYAASSHIFGAPTTSPQNETTPLRPTNIYAISKAAGLAASQYYRKNYGLHTVTAILYNHESPYRKPEFVSQKIIRGALAIKQGKQDQLILGNLNAAIDWGYAPDYVDAMSRCLKLKHPGDFVVATGETHTVQEFVEIVFEELSLDWRRYVHINPLLLTKPHVTLKGNATKLRLATGWRPSMDFATLVKKLQKDTYKIMGNLHSSYSLCPPAKETITLDGR